MAKEPRDFTADDIAREMEKRPDSLDHLRARAEMERRRTRYMLISAIATSVSAMGAAIAAIAAGHRCCTRRPIAPPCPWRARRLQAETGAAFVISGSGLPDIGAGLKTRQRLPCRFPRRTVGKRDLSKSP